MGGMTETHDDEIRKQFSRQAVYFNEEGRTLSSAEYLQWVVGCLNLKPDFVVLDVAPVPAISAGRSPPGFNG